MSLNRYGILIKQYLQKNEPKHYKELSDSGSLDDVIEKRQREIMQYRKEIKEYNDFDDKKIDQLLEKVMYRSL